MTEIATQQEQLMARFRFGDPPAPRVPPLVFELGGGRGQLAYREDMPWQPRDIERAFATVRAVFRLGQQMAVTDEPHEEGGFLIISTGADFFDPSTELPRERQPLEVVRVSMGSLEVVLAVSGILATAKVLRYVFGLIEEAFTLRPVIRKERAVLEAERLDAELRAMQTKQEMIRLAALQLDAAAPKPVAVDFWLGNGDEPPQLEDGDPVGP